MNDSSFLIIGANGQLGTALRAQYPNARAVDAKELDITNPKALAAYDWSGITAILNAAAYTNVDGAETTEGRRLAWSINATALSHLAAVATSIDATLVHISSDYVFDGTEELHDESEGFAPLSVYGASKAAGDIAAASTAKHYILRTSWVIGEGNNFVRIMQSLAAKGIKPSVVNDQIGRLSFTKDLVGAIHHLLSVQAPYGTYNVSNSGKSASWAYIAKKIFTLSGHSAEDITEVSTEKYYHGKENIAPRPLQSTLNIDKIQNVGFTPPDWEEALDEYIQPNRKD